MFHCYLSSLSLLYLNNDVTRPCITNAPNTDHANVLQLGIQAIFKQGGSGITKMLNTNEELYVSKAVQKAFIEVNEEGAEAAAASGKPDITLILYTSCWEITD